MDPNDKGGITYPSKDEDLMSLVDLWFQTSEGHHQEAQLPPSYQSQSSLHPWHAHRESGSVNESTPEFMLSSVLPMVPGNLPQAQRDHFSPASEGRSAPRGTEQQARQGMPALGDFSHPHPKNPANPSHHSRNHSSDHIYLENPANILLGEPEPSQAVIQQFSRTQSHNPSVAPALANAPLFMVSHGLAKGSVNTTQQILGRPNTPLSGNNHPGMQMAASSGKLSPNARDYRFALPMQPPPKPPSNNIHGNPFLHDPSFSSADIGLVGPSGSHSFHGQGVAAAALVEPSSSDDAVDEDITCTLEEEAFFLAYIQEIQSRSYNCNAEINCKLCPTRTFGRRYDLILHIRSMHLLQRNFQCDSCIAKFKRKSHLESHVKAIHEKSARYQCIYCFKTYTSDSTRRKHCRQVHKTDVYDLPQ